MVGDYFNFMSQRKKTAPASRAPRAVPAPHVPNSEPIEVTEGGDVSATFIGKLRRSWELKR
jgi:hypothetical protein